MQQPSAAPAIPALHAYLPPAHHSHPHFVLIIDGAMEQNSSILFYNKSSDLNRTLQVAARQLQIVLSKLLV